MSQPIATISLLLSALRSNFDPMICNYDKFKQIRGKVSISLQLKVNPTPIRRGLPKSQPLNSTRSLLPDRVNHVACCRFPKSFKDFHWMIHQNSNQINCYYYHAICVMLQVKYYELSITVLNTIHQGMAQYPTQPKMRSNIRTCKLW